MVLSSKLSGCGKIEAASDTICTQMYFRTLSSPVGTLDKSQVGHTLTGQLLQEERWFTSDGTIYSKVDYPRTTYFMCLVCDAPILEDKPTPFLFFFSIKLLQRVIFSRKYTHLASFPCPTQLSVIHAGNETNTHLFNWISCWLCYKQEPTKKQDEELTSEGKHHLLLLHKQTHDKEHCWVLYYFWYPM